MGVRRFGHRAFGKAQSFRRLLRLVLRGSTRRGGLGLLGKILVQGRQTIFGTPCLDAFRVLIAPGFFQRLGVAGCIGMRGLGLNQALPATGFFLRILQVR